MSLAYVDVDDVRITTVDNPYDVFDDFDKWFAYDESRGYHTCSYLARVANTSSSLSDRDNNVATLIAINEIIDINGDEFYKKVHRSDNKRTFVSDNA